MAAKSANNLHFFSYLFNYTPLRAYLKFSQSRNVSTLVVVTRQANLHFLKLNYVYSYLHVQNNGQNVLQSRTIYIIFIFSELSNLLTSRLKWDE